MNIFWRLMLGHLLCDFTLQTNFINRWKRTSQWGLLVHCVMHPIAYLILTWPFLGDYWISNSLFQLNGWTCIAIIFIVHYLEDWWRVFTISKYGMPDNTLFFAWDQVIHCAVIFSVAPLAVTTTPAAGYFPEKWTVLGCLFVLITHACTVLVYFVEKDLHGADYPANDEKHLAMAERLVLSLCFMFPTALGAGALAAVWLGVMFYLRRSRLFDLTAFTFYTGATVAVLCGLAARFVYYA